MKTQNTHGTTHRLVYLIGLTIQLGCVTWNAANIPVSDSYVSDGNDSAARESARSNLPGPLTPTLRERQEDSVIMPPAPCTLGGAPDLPSTEAKRNRANSIEFGLTTYPEEKSPRHYIPYVQYRCR